MGQGVRLFASIDSVYLPDGAVDETAVVLLLRREEDVVAVGLGVVGKLARVKHIAIDLLGVKVVLALHVKVGIAVSESESWRVDIVLEAESKRLWGTEALVLRQVAQS